MKETVDKILKAEGTARQKIERARKESLDIVQKAKEEAAKSIQAAVSAAEAAALASQDQSNKRYILEKEKELKAVKDKISSERIKKDIPAVSQKIFLEIIQKED